MKAALCRNRGTLGFARWAGYLILGAIGLIWAGGQGVYTAARNQRPLTVGYEEYVRNKPPAHWLNLTNCQLDFAAAAYEEASRGQGISKLYIPLRNSPEETQVHVLLATRDRQLIGLMQETVGFKSDQQAEAWLAKHSEEFARRRAVTGLVQFGLELKDATQQHLGKLYKQDPKELIIISDGHRPSWTSSLTLLGSGLILLVAMLARKKRDPEAPRDN